MGKKKSLKVNNLKPHYFRRWKQDQVKMQNYVYVSSPPGGGKVRLLNISLHLSLLCLCFWNPTFPPATNSLSLPAPKDTWHQKNKTVHEMVMATTNHTIPD